MSSRIRSTIRPIRATVDDISDPVVAMNTAGAIIAVKMLYVSGFIRCESPSRRANSRPEVLPGPPEDSSVSMPIDAEADSAPNVTEHVDEVGPSQHDTECSPDQSHLQSVTVRRRSLRREILRSIDLDRNQNGFVADELLRHRFYHQTHRDDRSPHVIIPVVPIVRSLMPLRGVLAVRVRWRQRRGSPTPGVPCYSRAGRWGPRSGRARRAPGPVPWPCPAPRPSRRAGRAPFLPRR